MRLGQIEPGTLYSISRYSPKPVRAVEIAVRVDRYGYQKRLTRRQRVVVVEEVDGTNRRDVFARDLCDLDELHAQGAARAARVERVTVLRAAAVAYLDAREVEWSDIEVYWERKWRLGGVEMEICISVTLPEAVLHVE